MSAKIIVSAAIAVALLGSLPASAADLGPPGYYPPRAYQEYPAPVIRKRIIHERVVVERPLYVHRRPIVVERPSPDEHVPPTFHVSGTASVFEATLVVQTLMNGKTVERKTVTASDGAPARGTFDVTMHARPGQLVVRAFSPSAADGSPQHEVRVHVVVTP